MTPAYHHEARLPLLSVAFSVLFGNDAESCAFPRNIFHFLLYSAETEGQTIYFYFPGNAGRIYHFFHE
ncbi:hypothetical protein AUL54_01885 [Bacillus sp. SDLI1]|nr:hypothetical protein AUL54_01885 [Bacillus sp. SDLI1]